MEKGKERERAHIKYFVILCSFIFVYLSSMCAWVLSFLFPRSQATWSFKKKSHLCYYSITFLLCLSSIMMDIRILPKFFGLRLCHSHSQAATEWQREFYLLDRFNIVRIVYQSMLSLYQVKNIVRIEAITKKKNTEEKRIHTSLYNIVSLTTLVLFNVVPKYSLIFVGVVVAAAAAASAAAAAAAVVCTLFVRFFFESFPFLSYIHSFFYIYL